MRSSETDAQQRPPSMNHSGTRADRTGSEESWVEIASQPSSSSLSSVAESIATNDVRIENPRRRRRRPRDAANPASTASGSRRAEVLAQIQNASDMSSQEEFEESESESDRVLTSSNEGIIKGSTSEEEDIRHSDEDENRTAVNYPIRNLRQDTFTPQPNAFSHPPSSRSVRHASEPCPGSYFPQMSSRTTTAGPRHSFSGNEARVQHSPFNALSPSHNAAALNHAALTSSLNTLLSCANAARGLTKSRPQPALQTTAGSSSRIQPNTLRLVPESALPGHVAVPVAPPVLEPDFLPTIRQAQVASTATSSDDARPRSSSPEPAAGLHKRKSGAAATAGGSRRESSKDRLQREQRSSKKARRASSASSASTLYSSSGEELLVSPTLLTWVVGAGVVVVLSAISFTAGYAVGHEVGRIEGAGDLVGGAGAEVGSCAAEVGRGSGLGLRRLRFAVQA